MAKLYKVAKVDFSWPRALKNGQICQKTENVAKLTLKYLGG